MGNYRIVYDEFMLKQLERLEKNKHLKLLLGKIFAKIEEKGLMAGNLLDSHIFLYEVKMKRPPLRVYYYPKMNSGEIVIMSYEMKTSQRQQQQTIDKLKEKISKSKVFSVIFLFLEVLFAFDEPLPQ